MSESSIAQRAELLGKISEAQRLLPEGDAVTLDTALFAASLTAFRLAIQVEALVESRAVAARIEADALTRRVEAGEQIELSAVSRLVAEAERCVRLYADNAATMRGLLYPTSILNLMPDVTAAGGLPGVVAPLPCFASPPTQTNVDEEPA